MRIIYKIVAELNIRSFKKKKREKIKLLLTK